MSTTRLDEDGDTGMEFWLILFAVLGMGYLVSLRLNPWVKCSRCRGTPRRRGWMYMYAHHICPKCGGSGQQLRMGRKVLGLGTPQPPSP
ncbi:MAG TPA: hypothetical protein VFR74_10260 [Jiangellales bacterium]|nr:hypothetical protein [Jiangellales bacterium]